MIFDSSLNSWSEGSLAGFVGEAGALGDVALGAIAFGDEALGVEAFGIMALDATAFGNVVLGDVDFDTMAFGTVAFGVVNLSIVDAFGSFESTIEALLADKSLAAMLIWPVSFIF